MVKKEIIRQMKGQWGVIYISWFILSLLQYLKSMSQWFQTSNQFIWSKLFGHLKIRIDINIFYTQSINFFYVVWSQGCILLTYLSVIFSKFIQKFAQKCQYFTLIDQSVPLYNFYITFYLRTNQLCLYSLISSKNLFLKVKKYIF